MFKIKKKTQVVRLILYIQILFLFFVFFTVGSEFPLSFVTINALSGLMAISNAIIMHMLEKQGKISHKSTIYASWASSLIVVETYILTDLYLK